MSNQHEVVALVTGALEHSLDFELPDGTVVQVNKLYVSEEKGVLAPTLLIDPEARIAMVKRRQPERQVYAKVPGSVIERARKLLAEQESKKPVEAADA